MTKNKLTTKLEKIFYRWSEFLPEDAIPMFRDEIQEVIELSKNIKNNNNK